MQAATWVTGEKAGIERARNVRVREKWWDHLRAWRRKEIVRGRG